MFIRFLAWSAVPFTCAVLTTTAKPLGDKLLTFEQTAAFFGSLGMFVHTFYRAVRTLLRTSVDGKLVGEEFVFWLPSILMFIGLWMVNPSHLNLKDAEFPVKTVDSNDGTKTFIGVKLRNRNLKDADFEHASLPYAIFERSDLEGAKLKDADLSGADLRGAKNLTQPQLDNAKWKEPPIVDAPLKTTPYYHWTQFPIDPQKPTPTGKPVKSGKQP